MKQSFRIRPIDVMVIGSIAIFCVYKSTSRPPPTGTAASAFARQVDLDPLYRTAVQADGRLRSFESHAKTYMGYVSGGRSINGQSNGFTYLDLLFRPQAYADTDLIYVKHKDVRAQVLQALSSHSTIDEADYDRIEKSGLFARRSITEPVVMSLLQRLGQDLIRTSKAVDAISSALAVSEPRFLSGSLRVIAPPGGERDRLWISPTELAAPSGAPQDDVHSGMQGLRTIPGLDTGLQEEISNAWSGLRKSWRDQDAAAVNAQVTALAGLLPRVSPGLYPSESRLSMESWYFRWKSMTWVWLFYLASVIPLLMSVIYKWDRARTIGLGLFVFAFAAHTASVAVRWYISGRWPNANMFEAVTTAAWFGGVAALVLERIVRRTPFRNLFALGSAVMSMGALMAAYYLPAQLDSGISNKMAALNDIWLYIHTNMIIWSYAVIGLACIPALLLLRHRWCRAWDEATISKLRLLALPVAAVVVNYTGDLLLMHLIAPESFELSGASALGVMGAFWVSAMIVAFEVLSARARRTLGARVGRSATGGAASLITGPGSPGSFLRREGPTTGQVLDGATMVLVELSFIMLWTGVVMGAIWADHSWGRPWGWDPKEVFALNTFIIFLVLIHVRLVVRDKAFWTALLAVAGFEVMMFNWIVVNFVITGLHSYA